MSKLYLFVGGAAYICADQLLTYILGVYDLLQPTTKAITLVPGIAAWIIALLLVAAVLRTQRMRVDWVVALAYAAIMSNLVGYIVYGSVQDYIKLGQIYINLSDCVISLGLLAIVVRSVRQTK